jgi:Cytochrome b5-like Heme/Steroid binding domain
MFMRKLVIFALAFIVIGAAPASAHQPVTLLETDITPNSGPLLVDGTVSFAIRAVFTKAGEKRAFRASYLAGDSINIQYLIVDKKPENSLRSTQLPTVVLTSPSGSSVTMILKERTKFFEPFGKVTYLYLARYRGVAQAGTYNFVVTSKGRASITIAVGDKEVSGQVLRGDAARPIPTPIPTPTPTASPNSTPTPEITRAGFTMEKVSENKSAASCWTVINGHVYNLTQWINSHPGGQSAIRALCGVDGSAAFDARHGGQSDPMAILQGYLLGPLVK